MIYDGPKLARLYREAQAVRSVYEEDWRSAALHCLPAAYQGWVTPHGNTQVAPMQAARRRAYDTTGARSLPKYASILERLATPSNQIWHQLRASDESLNQQRRVKEYFDALNSWLFKKRYEPKARFTITSNECYAALGVYGNGPIYVGQRKGKFGAPPGLGYIPIPMRDVFVLLDDEGNTWGFFRRSYWNARQAMAKLGERCPDKIKTEATKQNPGEHKYYEFAHFVHEADEDDYDPTALNYRRHTHRSYLLFVDEQQLVGEVQGYAGMPYVMPRSATEGGQHYGYSPALTALGSLGSASAIKKQQLMIGNRAATPTYFAHDDAMMNGPVDNRPGAVNYGAVNRDGRLLVHQAPPGDYRVNEAVLESERLDVQDAFLVTLFQILTETPEMTATEVIERVAEKAALLAPTMGRLQSEKLGPMIEREIAIGNELGQLPEMPPELVEAQGEYEVLYTSPMAKSMKAEEISGFVRSYEMAANMASASGDPSSLDHFDVDVAVPEIMDNMAVPTRWTRSLDAIAQLREQRAAQAQQSELIQNAGGLASAAGTLMQNEGTG